MRTKWEWEGSQLMSVTASWAELQPTWGLQSKANLYLRATVGVTQSQMTSKRNSYRLLYTEFPSKTVLQKFQHSELLNRKASGRFTRWDEWQRLTDMVAADINHRADNHASVTRFIQEVHPNFGRRQTCLKPKVSTTRHEQKVSRCRIFHYLGAVLGSIYPRSLPSCRFSSFIITTLIALHPTYHFL